MIAVIAVSALSASARGGCETSAGEGRLTGMRAGTFASPSSTAPRPRVGLWVAGILAFLLLSVAAALRADAAEASRRETLDAPRELKSLAVKVVNGEISVSAGPRFSATVELKATAPTKEEADRLLGGTKVRLENAGGDVTLVADEPWAHARSSGGERDDAAPSRRNVKSAGHVEVRWTIVLPAATPLTAGSVNGAVSVRGIEARLDLSTVNGGVEVAGARGDLTARTVNGGIEGTFAALPPSVRVDVETVNGGVVLRFPASAGFSLSARTMNGEIVSTFPLPAQRAEERVRREAERARRAAEKAGREARSHPPEGTPAPDGSVPSIDRAEVEAEVEREMAEVEREMAHLSEEASRHGDEIARAAANVNRSYEGSVGAGGARVHASTLNGKIAILGGDAPVSSARSLLPGRHARVVTVPPVPPVPPSAGEAGGLVRGDVAGDIYTSLPYGDVDLGRVSGHVKVTTSAGRIRVREAGKGAELVSSGGDVKIDRVQGDLVAVTSGGDVTAGPVSGSARLETSGGDLKLASAGGRSSRGAAVETSRSVPRRVLFASRPPVGSSTRPSPRRRSPAPACSLRARAT